MLNSRRILYLENTLLRIGIYLDKGAELFEFRHKPTDIDAMWCERETGFCSSRAREIEWYRMVPGTMANNLQSRFSYNNDGYISECRLE